MTSLNGAASASTNRFVIIAPIVRIEPERDGDSWLVITPSGNAWVAEANEREIITKLVSGLAA